MAIPDESGEGTMHDLKSGGNLPAVIRGRARGTNLGRSRELGIPLEPLQQRLFGEQHDPSKRPPKGPIGIYIYIYREYSGKITNPLNQGKQLFLTLYYSIVFVWNCRSDRTNMSPYAPTWTHII